jgi:hypothetical protein
MDAVNSFFNHTNSGMQYSFCNTLYYCGYWVFMEMGIVSDVLQ